MIVFKSSACLVVFGTFDGVAVCLDRHHSDKEMRCDWLVLKAYRFRRASNRLVWLRGGCSRLCAALLVLKLAPRIKWLYSRKLCMCGHHSQQTRHHQLGMVANPSHGQLNKETSFEFPVPVLA